MALNSNPKTRIKPLGKPYLNKAHPLSVGLLNYWVLNEPSGTSSVDLVGRITGAHTNTPVHVSGDTGSQVLLNATTAVIDLSTGTFLTTGQPFSVCWRTKDTGTSTTTMGRLTLKLAGTSDYFHITATNDQAVGPLYWGRAPATAGQPIKSSTMPTQASGVGKYRNYVLTGNSPNSTTASDWVLYIDGVLYATAATSGTTVGTPTTSRIGGTGNADTTFDYLRLYNRKLSQSEVRDLYLNPLAGVIAPTRNTAAGIATLPYTDTPTSLGIVASGYIPTVITTTNTPFTGTPASLPMSLLGGVALFNAASINTTGRGFHSALNVPNVNISGRGFSTPFPIIAITPDFPNTVTGRGFSTTPQVFGGGIATGQGFTQTPVITVLANNEFTVTGRGLATQLGFSYSAPAVINVSGGGISTSPQIYGGSVVTGRGFGSSLGYSALTSETITVTGRGFGTVLSSYALAPATITVIGGGFSSGLSKLTITGQGIATFPVIQFASASVNTEALVMNVVNNAVTRYVNYPFMHIATIGGKSYGVKSDGLYLLDGNTDLTAAINGTIITMEDDFGIFQSKNVPYVYLNGDDTYKVTPIVDGVNKPSVKSTFKGRKAHPGRGNKGRYWAFKIEGIEHLQGVEYLPDQLQRRVK